MKRTNRRKLTGIFVLLAIFSVAAVVLATTYLGMDIQQGFDPTDGSEIRYCSGTYCVPVIPESALIAAIAYTDASATLIGSLPAGAYVTDVEIIVKTAFNAGTTNTLTVGTSGDADAYADATDSKIDIISTTSVSDKTVQVTSDTDVYFTYAQSGTAASAGAGFVVVRYIVPPS